MRVRFHEISPSGSRFELNALKEVPDLEDIIIQGPVDARCTLRRKGDDKVELQGHLRATLSVVCDRCLQRYDLTVDTEMHLLFALPGNGSWQVKELECQGNDLDTVLVDEPVVDLDDTFRQQIFLSLPIKSLCSEQCRGICSQCGANLNATECTCFAKENDSPFSVLSALTK